MTFSKSKISITSGTASVVSQFHLSGKCFRLELLMPEISEFALPGQFVEISTKGATLLNKPISIAAVSKQNFFPRL